MIILDNNFLVTDELEEPSYPRGFWVHYIRYLNYILYKGYFNIGRASKVTFNEAWSTLYDIFLSFDTCVYFP